MKKFYPVTGLVISFFIASMGYVMRLNREDIGASVLTFSSSFVNSFLSWLFIQYVLTWRKPAGYGWKAVLAIAGCMIISLFPFTITRHFAEVQDRVDALPRGIQAVNFLLLMRGLVIGGFLYFIAYLLRMSARRRQSELENEQLKKENLQARLSLLQEQVSPHFLFNSLGTLRSMLHERAPREFIQRLSEVYRYLLNNRMADLVALQEELDFTLAYLHILNERFEDALVTHVEIADGDLRKRLPPASLQLLVENAVKHNVATAGSPLSLSIRTEEGDWLKVTNSVQKKNKAGESLGSGLNNIRERYRLLAGLDIVVEETAASFSVRIPLLSS
ncbi:sensor histidine kinase [Pseudoflavitalea rhizosphaerae]|uniref:sensor histidine kinase n=1 Tax=Pseudoflavitalea rhizosphaerae TaxID=1884793 RepID=UPI0013E00BC2|nr:histidine kinase [Pseudoflavitalea rhizosphaerae]